MTAITALPVKRIRQATLEDLPKLEPEAREFYASSRFLKTFDMKRFVTLWTTLMEREMGVVFLLEGDEGEIHGALGATIYPDAYSDRLIATELFWFVLEEHRGYGFNLLREFERWARDKRCAEIRMVHLLDVMPERLSAAYKRLGFEAAEVHYVKEI